MARALGDHGPQSPSPWSMGKSHNPPGNGLRRTQASSTVATEALGQVYCGEPRCGDGLTQQEQLPAQRCRQGVRSCRSRGPAQRPNGQLSVETRPQDMDMPLHLARPASGLRNGSRAQAQGRWVAAAEVSFQVHPRKRWRAMLRWPEMSCKCFSNSAGTRCMRGRVA